MTWHYDWADVALTCLFHRCSLFKMSSTRWCWTFFTENDPAWRPTFNDQMKFLIYEMETCPTTGRPHLQGYMRTTRKIRMTGAKALLHPSCHLEMAKGTEQENIDYCSKTGIGLVQEGTPNLMAGIQGARTDLKAACTAIEEGATTQQIATEFPTLFVRYHQGLEALIRAREKPPISREVSTTVLWGPTATGKSHRARTSFPDGYVVSPGRDPFGGYTGQKTIIFEEWNHQDWPIRDMNRYMDKWTSPISSRYYNKTSLWTKVIIISNLPPESYYVLEDPRLREAFMRRITTIHEVTSINQEILLI